MSGCPDCSRTETCTGHRAPWGERRCSTRIAGRASCSPCRRCRAPRRSDRGCTRVRTRTRWGGRSARHARPGLRASKPTRARIVDPRDPDRGRVGHVPGPGAPAAAQQLEVREPPAHARRAPELPLADAGTALAADAAFAHRPRGREVGDAAAMGRDEASAGALGVEEGAPRALGAVRHLPRAAERRRDPAREHAGVVPADEGSVDRAREVDELKRITVRVLERAREVRDAPARVRPVREVQRREVRREGPALGGGEVQLEGEPLGLVVLCLRERRAELDRGDLALETPGSPAFDEVGEVPGIVGSGVHAAIRRIRGGGCRTRRSARRWRRATPPRLGSFSASRPPERLCRGVRARASLARRRQCGLRSTRPPFGARPQGSRRRDETRRGSSRAERDSEGGSRSRRR